MKGTMFTECRVLGHSWSPVTVTREGSDFIQLLRCPVCLTERRWRIGPTGMPRGNSYTYAEGYREDGGLKPAEKDALRLRFVRSRAPKK